MVDSILAAYVGVFAAVFVPLVALLAAANLIRELRG